MASLLRKIPLPPLVLPVVGAVGAIVVLLRAKEALFPGDDSGFSKQVKAYKRCNRCSKKGVKVRCHKCRRAWYCSKQCLKVALADRSLVNELYSLAARLSLTDLTVRRDPTPPARAHVINARYTPIAKSAPPTAPMTYRCAGGLGAPAQSSYAMTPLEPARTRRREEEGGALVQRREGRRGRRMEGERARRDATRDGGLERRFDSIPRARAHRRTRTRR